MIMAKSIKKSSVVFFLFLNIFFSLFSNAQTNILGTWKIDRIIGVNDYNEYSLVAQKEFSWGNNLKMDLDGTFVSRYLAECGSDCFTSSSGRFMIIDDAHIRFILINIHYSGCGKELKSESDLNKDLGIFYIYKDSKSIRLIKSNGVLQDDKNKMLYAKMLNTFDENWKSYDYSWVNTKANTSKEILKDCVGNKKTVDLLNCQIVFSKKEDYGELFLVREKKNFHYVLYNESEKKVSLAYPR